MGCGYMILPKIFAHACTVVLSERQVMFPASNPNFTGCSQLPLVRLIQVSHPYTSIHSQPRNFVTTYNDTNTGMRRVERVVSFDICEVKVRTFKAISSPFLH